MSYLSGVVSSLYSLNSLVNQQMLKIQQANQTGQVNVQIPSELMSAIGQLSGLLHSTKSGANSSAIANNASIAYTSEKLSESGAEMPLIKELLDSIEAKNIDNPTNRNGQGDVYISLKNRIGVCETDIQSILIQATKISSIGQDINKYFQNVLSIIKNDNYADLKRFINENDIFIAKEHNLEKL